MIQALAYLPAIAGTLFLGSLVGLRNAHSTVNRLFVAINLVVAAWLAGLFAADTSVFRNVDESLLFVRLAMLVSLFLPLLFLWFAKVLVNKVFTKLQLWLLYAPLFLLQVISMTNLGVTSVKPGGFGAQIASSNWGYTAIVFFTVGYIAWAVGALLRRLSKLNFHRRGQVNLIVFGTAVAVLIDFTVGYVLALLKLADYAVL